MQINSIAGLVESVQHAGAIALEEQRRVAIVERSYKQDGSILTEVDQKVEDYLVGELSHLYPGANIIGEEARRSYDASSPYTFAVDPIDGTDVYSLGMPGWCVSVGLLDEQLQPVAGIIYAPKWDLLLFADLGERVRAEGAEIVAPHPVDLTSEASSLMASSRIHRWLDLKDYRGKVRSVGSAALHLAFQLVYPTVDGALQHPGACIWDLAGSHALLRSCGLTVEYLSGQPVDYAELLDGSKLRDVVLAGSLETVQGLRELVTRR
jgi:myo-inositol-1(or 4)-monophosphatase